MQAAGQCLVAGLFGGRRRAAAQVDGGGLRWVAQAGIGTALPAQAQLALGVGRNQQFELVAVHRAVTEELVMVIQRGGELRLLFGRQAVELQALLVQVVTLLDLEVQAHLAIGLAVVSQHERLVDRQEVGFGVERVGLQRASQQERQEEQKDAHVFALAVRNGGHAGWGRLTQG